MSEEEGVQQEPNSDVKDLTPEQIQASDEALAAEQNSLATGAAEPQARADGSPEPPPASSNIEEAERTNAENAEAAENE